MFEVARSLTVPFLAVASVLILIEMTISSLRNLKLYRSKDTLCNLFIMLLGRLSQPLFAGYIYATLSPLEALSVFKIPETTVTTVLAVFLTDLVYYWEHRLSHSTRFLWFFHEIHHSSKHFNLTTSFRLHWLGRLTAPLIFAPLILIGFKAEQVLIFFIANLFYQFLLHTKTVGKLGPLEGIINTPSAHRVHHARNKIYIDKNFGGILMLWDRLFGTYQPETESPQFGILGKFESDNPFTVQFHNLPGYSLIVERLRGLAQAALMCFLILGSLAAVLGFNQSPALAEEPSSRVSPAAVAAPLQGRVEAAEQASQPDAMGLWKAHIRELHRHPKVLIQSCEGTQVAGIYSGLLGKFPLTGEIDNVSGCVALRIDFSKAAFGRWRSRKTLIGHVNGSLAGDTMSGTAMIPELGDRIVHFEAKKAAQ